MGGFIPFDPNASGGGGDGESSLILSNNHMDITQSFTQTATNTVQLTRGVFRNSDNSEWITNEADLTVNTHSTSGTPDVVGIGGLSTQSDTEDGGVLDDTWYDIYILIDTNEVNPTGGVMHREDGVTFTGETGYDAFRKIGFVYHDTIDDIREFDCIQEGRKIRYTWHGKEHFVDNVTDAGDITYTTEMDAFRYPTARWCQFFFGIFNISSVNAGRIQVRSNGDTSIASQGAVDLGVGDLGSNSDYYGMFDMDISDNFGIVVDIVFVAEYDLGIHSFEVIL